MTRIEDMGLDEISSYLYEKYGGVTVCKDAVMAAKEQTVLEIQANKKAYEDADYMGDRQEYIYNRGKYQGAVAVSSITMSMLEEEKELEIPECEE